MKKINVAVDGTAGSGKTFIFKKVANELKYKLIDTGAMYRAFTYYIYINNINFDNKNDVIQSIPKFDLSYNEGKIYINNKTIEISDKLSSPEVTNNINKITGIPEVREKMVNVQREIGNKPGVIELGRDITTVVLPDANLKIYLDSPVEIRAKRRYEQNLEEGIHENYEEVFKKIEERDLSDKTRPIGALKIADDAWYIDSSLYEADDLIKIIVNKIKTMEEK